MKMILTFIPPYRLDRVTRALEHVTNFPGMSVSEARGFGHEKLDRVQDARDQLEDFTEAVREACASRPASEGPMSPGGGAHHGVHRSVDAEEER